MVSWLFLLEGSSPVLEEFLLSPVEDLGCSPTHRITSLWLLLQQTRPQDADPFLARIASVASSCVLSISLMGERVSAFPTEPEQMPVAHTRSVVPQVRD
jgi:hypothetical protein